MGARGEGATWPLHGIRLRTADVDLQVMTEADVPTLWSLLPDDVELNPHATTYAGLNDRANRRAVLAQAYWRALGLWSPDDWALPFVVRAAGGVVGVQWLEGPDWRADRIVDSSSWLVASARGRGLGRQMRGAVLALAFGPLRAEAAISSAVTGNASSLGVSRALGYVHTHCSVLEHSGQTLQHVRLERSTWEGSHHAHGTVIDGATQALPLFGIEAAG